MASHVLRSWPHHADAERKPNGNKGQQGFGRMAAHLRLHFFTRKDSSGQQPRCMLFSSGTSAAVKIKLAVMMALSPCRIPILRTSSSSPRNKPREQLKRQMAAGDRCPSFMMPAPTLATQSALSGRPFSSTQEGDAGLHGRQTKLRPHTKGTTSRRLIQTIGFVPK